MVIEGTLEGEMDDHLGYAKHLPPTLSRKTGQQAVRAIALTRARPGPELWPGRSVLCAAYGLVNAPAGWLGRLTDPGSSERSRH